MKSKRKITWVILLGVFTTLSCAVAIDSAVGVDADTSFSGYYAETFDVNLATLTPNATLSDADKQGIGVSTKYEGAYAQLKNRVGGDFSLEFSFDELVDGYAVSEFVTEFVAEDGKDVFSVHVSQVAGEVMVKVGIGEEYHGLYYSEDGSLSEQTSIMNASGLYTTFDAADIYYLQYDEESGEVLFGADETEMVRVWNVSATLLDGKKCDVANVPDSYYARFNLSKLNFPKNAYAKDYAGMILYSVNGQRLNGKVLTDTVGPNVCANFIINPIVGGEYSLPVPVATDVLCGDMENVRVQVKNNGVTVLDEIYQDGVSFVPQEGGVYTITYTATDSEGKTGTFTKTVRSVSDTALEYVFDSNFIESEVGVGSSFILPEFYAQGDLLVQTTTNDVFLKVYRNDTLYKTYADSNALRNSRFTFEESGEYEFVFGVNGCDEGYTYTEKVVAKNELASIYLEKKISSVYQAGETVEFPVASMSLNGTSGEVKRVIYTPSGNAYSLLNGRYTLAETGEYTLEYRMSVDGEVYIYSYRFSTYEPFIKTTGRATSVSSQKGEKQGKLVTFYSTQEEVRSDRVIDLREFSANESFLVFSFLPQWTHMLDFNDVYVVLTDVYDESNYVTVKLNLMKNSETSYGTYALAGASCQQDLCGIHDGVSAGGTAFVNGAWGTYTRVSPMVQGDVVRLAYDLAKNIVSINFTNNDSANRGIIDLDSLAYFDKEWKGFTTGEVKLSLKIGELSNTKGLLYIEKIGKDYAYTESTATDVIVDMGDYTEYPNAVVGEEMPLFPAFAMLDGKKLPASVSVRFADNKNIELATDGVSFTPLYACDYSVVYTVQTYYGVLTKEVKLTAVGETPDMTVEKVGDFAFVAGVEGDIPTFEVKNAIGFSQTSVTFTYENGVSETVKIGEKYTPKYAGEITVRYEATDYLGRKATAQYTTECITIEKPIFNVTDFNLSYVVAGQSYALPMMTAIDYDNGNAELTASVSVVSGGVETQLPNYTYTPLSTDAQKTVYVKYTVQGVAGTNTVEYPVQIMSPRDNNGLYDVRELFVTENTTVQGSADGLVLSTETEGATAQFINGVLADNFNFTFKVKTANFDKFSIYLSDAENPLEKVKVSFENGSDSVNVRINDTVRVYKGIKGTFGSNAIFDLSYQVSDCVLFNATGELNHKLKLNVFGEDFVGFTSGAVNVSVVFEGVHGNSSVCILYLNNQSFIGQINNDGKIRDVFEPQIAVFGDYGGVIEYNSTYTTYKAEAFDVLAGKVEVDVSIIQGGKHVYTFDNQAIKNVTATTEYQFKISQYGNYSVIYTAKDTDGGTASFTYRINVMDLTAPVIMLTERLYDVYTVGSTVRLPNATATDNVEGDVLLYIVISSPDGLVKLYNGDGNYCFTQKGKYVISYYAYDASNNVSVIDINVRVE